MIPSFESIYIAQNGIENCQLVLCLSRFFALRNLSEEFLPSSCTVNLIFMSASCSVLGHNMTRGFFVFSTPVLFLAGKNVIFLGATTCRGYRILITPAHQLVAIACFAERFEFCARRFPIQHRGRCNVLVQLYHNGCIQRKLERRPTANATPLKFRLEGRSGRNGGGKRQCWAMRWGPCGRGSRWAGRFTRAHAAVLYR